MKVRIVFSFVLGGWNAAAGGAAPGAALPPAVAVTQLERKLEDKNAPLADRIKAGQSALEKYDLLLTDQRRLFDESSATLLVYGQLRD